MNQQRPDSAYFQRFEALDCPSCGDALRFQAAESRVGCQSCGYRPAEDVSALEKHAVTSEHWQSSRFELSELPEGLQTCACPDCGADFLLLPGAHLSRCEYCHSTHIAQSAADASMIRPDGVIPFAVSPKEAAQALSDALGPNGHLNEAELRRVFVPFLVVDGELEFAVSEHAKWPLELAQALGSTRSPRGLLVRNALVCTARLAFLPDSGRAMQSLAPFPLHQVANFSFALLASATAEPQRVAGPDLLRLAADTLHDAAKTRISAVLGRPLPEDLVAKPQDMRAALVLMPVYLGPHRLTYVNGATGKTAIGAPIGTLAPRPTSAQPAARARINAPAGRELALAALVVVFFVLVMFGPLALVMWRDSSDRQRLIQAPDTGDRPAVTEQIAVRGTVQGIECAFELQVALQVSGTTPAELQANSSRIRASDIMARVQEALKELDRYVAVSETPVDAWNADLRRTARHIQKTARLDPQALLALVRQVVSQSSVHHLVTDSTATLVSHSWTPKPVLRLAPAANDE